MQRPPDSPLFDDLEPAYTRVCAGCGRPCYDVSRTRCANCGGLLQAADPDRTHESPAEDPDSEVFDKALRAAFSAGDGRVHDTRRQARSDARSPRRRAAAIANRPDARMHTIRGTAYLYLLRDRSPQCHPRAAPRLVIRPDDRPHSRGVLFKPQDLPSQTRVVGGYADRCDHFSFHSDGIN
jgi:hypothetical protein